MTLYEYMALQKAAWYVDAFSQVESTISLLESYMTPAEFSEAQRLAREWLGEQGEN